MNMYNKRIANIRRLVEKKFTGLGGSDVSYAFEAMTLEVSSFDQLRDVLQNNRAALTWILRTLEGDWIDELHDEGVD